MASPSIVDGGYPPLAPVQNGSARFVPKIRLSDEKHARLPFPAEKRFSFFKIMLWYRLTEFNILTSQATKR